MSSDPLHISNEMKAFDRKDRSYYDKFTDEQKKKFSMYLMLRYGASCTGPTELQAYYLMSCNQRLNKHFFDLNKHTKLQWLLATTVSPNMGNKFHYWLAHKKKEGPSSKLRKWVKSHWPHLKEDEIDTLLTINDRKEFTAYAREHGYDSDQVKREL